MLQAIVPWSASGPGWANSGLTLFYEDRVTGKLNRRTIYQRDLRGDAAVLFPHVLHLYNDLQRAILDDENRAFVSPEH